MTTGSWQRHLTRLVVVTTPELLPGFRLAGVSACAAASAQDAQAQLLELLDRPGEAGAIALHEPFLRDLERPLRERVERLGFPLVLALPAGAPGGAEDERRERLRRMLWQAVGYEITFDEGGER